MGRCLAATWIATLALCATGCLVDSRCQTDDDCTGHETCDRLAGACRVECTKDSDCTVNGMNLGKECLGFRCQFRYEERVKAPGFCLEVVNPKSGREGQGLCLSSLSGKVVLIYFGLIA